MRKTVSIIIILALTIGLLSCPVFSADAVSPKRALGDFDGDNEITVADALAALRIAAKLAPEDESSITTGDVDKDGHVTVADALAILRVAAKLAVFDQKILPIQIGYDPEIMDPALNYSVDGGNMILFAFDCLLNIDKDNKVVAGAAEKWEVSDDGLVWTFTLRKGLKWSDGSPLTAQDFVYSWKRVANPDTYSPYGESLLGMVKGYDKVLEGNIDALAVEAKDDLTFVVTLDSPCASFDKLTAFPTLSPVKQAVVEKDQDGWSVSADTCICNGPFYIKEWVPYSHILFAKNKNYRDADKVKLDGIKCLFVDDASAAYAAYQSGEAYMIREVPTEQIAVLKGNADFHMDPIMGTYFITLNEAVAPLTNSSIRQALSLAIDRNYVAGTIMDGTYLPAPNFVGPSISDWDGSEFMSNANGGKAYIDVDAFDANLAKAKELMTAAGYSESNMLSITYSTNDAGYHKKVAEYLQQAWKEIFVDLKVEIVEWSSFMQRHWAGDFQICRNGWVCDFDDPMYLLEIFVSTSGNNDGKYNNSKYDELMAKAAVELDPQTRFGYMHAAEDILAEEAACIPVAYYTDYYLQNDKITGSWHSPYGYWYFMFADITD